MGSPNKAIIPVRFHLLQQKVHCMSWRVWPLSFPRGFLLETNNNNVDLKGSVDSVWCFTPLT